MFDASAAFPSSKAASMGGSYSLAFERLATFVAIHGSLLITARPTTLQPSGLRPNQANGCRPRPQRFQDDSVPGACHAKGEETTPGARLWSCHRPDRRSELPRLPWPIERALPVCQRPKNSYQVLRNRSRCSYTSFTIALSSTRLKPPAVQEQRVPAKTSQPCFASNMDVRRLAPIQGHEEKAIGS